MQYPNCKYIDYFPQGVESKCCTDGYVALTESNEGKIFKNAYCAACHGHPIETLSCFPMPSPSCIASSSEFSPRSFQLVLDHTQIKEEITRQRLRTNRVYNKTPFDKTGEMCQDFETAPHNKALGHITFMSFLVSILSLVFLLVTYITFPQLRTLPGKNIMSFSSSLLLFQVLWLPSNFTEVQSSKTICMVMAVIEHYMLMASFLSMSVIAFHTCKIFARNVPAPKMSEKCERKLFCRYLALVWLLPAVFVGICVVLDKQDVLRIGYGESNICWITETNANIYFVIAPIAVLLLLNIVCFIITAVYLRKHGQNIAARQVSGNRRSGLMIYVKLSTLMGFSWLFGLLALIVTSTTVFWYFFVILTSLQGVFVTAAFVFNPKTFGLYKQRFVSNQNARLIVQEFQLNKRT